MWQGAAAGGVYHEAARAEAQGAGARDGAAPVLALRPGHAGARVPGGGRALRVGECHDLEQAATRALKVATKFAVIFTMRGCLLPTSPFSILKAPISAFTF